MAVLVRMVLAKISLTFINHNYNEKVRKSKALQVSGFKGVRGQRVEGKDLNRNGVKNIACRARL